MALGLHMSLFTSLGVTSFFARFQRSELSSKNGFLKPHIAMVNCAIFFSCSSLTPVASAWWCFDVMDEELAICLACSASLASSGAIRKYFLRMLGFNVIPTSPPDTFIEWLTCSRALSGPTAQNGTYEFSLDLNFMQHLHLRKVDRNRIRVVQHVVCEKVLSEYLESWSKWSAQSPNLTAQIKDIISYTDTQLWTKEPCLAQHHQHPQTQLFSQQFAVTWCFEGV